MELSGSIHISTSVKETQLSFHMEIFGLDGRNIR